MDQVVEIRIEPLNCDLEFLLALIWKLNFVIKSVVEQMFTFFTFPCHER